MITLTKSGNAIVFTFDDNSHYLNDGTIEVPVNSLTLVTDESQMATFKKSATNDIFISATYDELGMSKADLESWFKENACGSTGGGSGSGMTSGEVQTMIDESISGKADTSDVQNVASDVATVSGDVNTLSGSVESLTGAVNTLSGDVSTLSGSVDSNHNAITALNGDVQTLSGDVANKADTTAVTASINSAVSGKVNTTDFNTYSASTDARLAEDEEVTSAALNELNEALSGKQDTLSAGTNITISGNVISAEGGTVDQAFDRVSTNAIANSAVTRNTVGSYSVDMTDGKSFLQAYDQKGYGLHNLSLGFSRINGRNILQKASNIRILTNFDLVETSAITSSVTSASTDSQVPSAKAVYDALQEGGGLPESAFTTYTASTDARLAEDEEVTAAGLNALNDALSGKQDTLSAGTNITISGNVISAEGGGKAIEAGRGISITTGATADTVSFNLPISAGTGANSLIFGGGSQTGSSQRSVAFGQGKVTGNAAHNSAAFGTSTVQGQGAFGQGGYSNAIGNNSHAEGNQTTAYTNNSHTEGAFTKTSNENEHASGEYNTTTSGASTSAQTLFSVGNGTADNARHNAFEIRKNGDIYLNDGTNDVRLQDTILALGGLKLVQISQSDYDNLQNKDASTLYIIT